MRPCKYSTPTRGCHRAWVGLRRNGGNTDGREVGAALVAARSGKAVISLLGRRRRLPGKHQPGAERHLDRARRDDGVTTRWRRVLRRLMLGAGEDRRGAVSRHQQGTCGSPARSGRAERPSAVLWQCGRAGAGSAGGTGSETLVEPSLKSQPPETPWARGSRPTVRRGGSGPNGQRPEPRWCGGAEAWLGCRPACRALGGGQSGSPVDRDPKARRGVRRRGDGPMSSECAERPSAGAAPIPPRTRLVRRRACNGGERVVGGGASLVPWSIVTLWAWRCVCPAGSVVAVQVAGGRCRAGRALSAHGGIGTWADGGPTSVALMGLRKGTPSDGFISASWRLVVLLRRRWPIVPVSTPVSGDSHGSLTLAAAASLPGHAKGRDRPASVVRRQANCRVGNSDAEASPSGLWPAQVETSAVKSWSKSCGTLRVAGAEPLRGDGGRAPAEPMVRLRQHGTSAGRPGHTGEVWTGPNLHKRSYAVLR